MLKDCQRLIILGSLPVPVYKSVDQVICYFNYRGRSEAEGCLFKVSYAEGCPTIS